MQITSERVEQKREPDGVTGTLTVGVIVILVADPFQDKGNSGRMLVILLQNVQWLVF